METKILILGILMMAVIVCGCAYPEAEKTFSRVYPSAEECEAAGAECVAELHNNELTGGYLVVGEVFEGEMFEIGFDEAEILDRVCKDPELRAVGVSYEINGECAVPTCPCYVCLRCPDTSCGPGENNCNCPEDCAPECRDESEECSISGTPCCPGLVPIPKAMELDGECAVAECGDFCRPCGNGVCDKDENRCNCPEDCE